MLTRIILTATINNIFIFFVRLQILYQMNTASKTGKTMGEI